VRFLVIVTVLLTIGATEARAYTIAGSGSRSCGSWSEHNTQYREGGPSTKASQHAVEDSAWVLGFLSGVGCVAKNGDNPLDGTDAQGVWAWINNCCQAQAQFIAGLFQVAA
jgi:hypothetical protein